VIIVDTDILAYCLIQGVRTEKAHALQKIDPDWRAPQLWRAEFVSVVNKYLKGKIISLVQAHEILAAAGKSFGGIDMGVDMAAVLSIAAATGASTYDAHFLALAQRTGRPLITGEKRHPGAPHGLAMNIEDFLRETT
jgi:predicted nucleic acid-binding protein